MHNRNSFTLCIKKEIYLYLYVKDLIIIIGVKLAIHMLLNDRLTTHADNN